MVVFNQTSVTGLAARFAARLEVAGWDVVGVDNWIGTVPATTVYYQPGDEAAARALMADFPDVGRIHPAVVEHADPLTHGGLDQRLPDQLTRRPV